MPVNEHRGVVYMIPRSFCYHDPVTTSLQLDTTESRYVINNKLMIHPNFFFELLYVYIQRLFIQRILLDVTGGITQLVHVFTYRDNIHY